MKDRFFSGTVFGFFASCFLLTGLCFPASASCNCPTETNCNACSGGLTDLSLKLNSNFGAFVFVYDSQEIYFSGFVRSGETIDLKGKKDNGKFEDPQLTVFVNGIFHYSIDVNCAQPLFIGTILGLFEVVKATSKEGGSICCLDEIKDTTPPEITNCPGDIVKSLNSTGCTVPIEWSPPEALDDCALASLTSNYTPGDEFPLGTTEVVYTATDSAGNTSSCSFEVRVTDDQPPAFSSFPSDIRVYLDAAGCSKKVNWAIPEISDNCGLESLHSNAAPGDEFPVGITEVEYTATDIAGNLATRSFRVTVTDTISPVIEDCPLDIVVDASSPDPQEITWREPTGSDNCDAFSIKSTHKAGESFPIGTTQVKYTATDIAGNLAECRFHVTVNAPDPARYLEISKIISPNGDGINDEWIIGNIEKYGRNSVSIIDRWGSLVYSEKNYNNENVVWKGTTSNGSRLPTGTYFFIIEVEASTKQMVKGFLELVK